MKEKLQERANQLDQLLKQTLANYHALEGAKQECMNMINNLEEEKKEESLSS